MANRARQSTQIIERVGPCTPVLPGRDSSEPRRQEDCTSADIRGIPAGRRLLVRQLSRGDLWRGLHEQAYMVGLHDEVFDLNLKLRRLPSKEAIEVGGDFLNQHGYTVFGHHTR